MLILLIRIPQWIFSDVPRRRIIAQLIISNFKYTKNSRKHQYQNKIEEHKDPKIIKHLPYHGYNIAHVLKDPQEKESLNQNQYRHHDQEDVFELLKA